jgi:hypothetical protein
VPEGFPIIDIATVGPPTDACPERRKRAEAVSAEVDRGTEGSLRIVQLDHGCERRGPMRIVVCSAVASTSSNVSSEILWAGMP